MLHSKFAVKARKANGEIYPPGTIHQLLCGLLQHIREMTLGCPNFLNKQDSQFRHLLGTLDAFFHKLHSNGIGVQVRHMEIITKANEENLWASGVMGDSNPRSLKMQHSFIHCGGKMFTLRGVVEHRNLKLSQLKCNNDPDHYFYQENVLTTNIKKLRIKEVVPIYASPDFGERCPVNILDTYLSKLPRKAIEYDLFFLRPLSRVPADPSSPWYASVPVGRDSLQNKLKNVRL